MSSRLLRRVLGRNYVGKEGVMRTCGMRGEGEGSKLIAGVKWEALRDFLLEL